MKPKAELGRVVAVKNKEPKLGSATHYAVVWVKYAGKPLQLMLTEGDLKKCAERAKKNPEDCIELVPSHAEFQVSQLQEASENLKADIVRLDKQVAQLQQNLAAEMRKNQQPKKPKGLFKRMLGLFRKG